MTTFRLGLISLCVVGVGVGAYIVNQNLKKDRNVNNSTNTTASGNVANNGGTSAAQGSNSSAPGSGAGTMSMTGDAGTTTGNAASPPPVVPSTPSGDSERSFRPHVPETTAVPPTPPSTTDNNSGAGTANTTGSGTGSPNAAPTPTDIGAASTGGMGTTTTAGNAGPANAPQPTTPTYTPPTPPPSVASSERMGLTAPTPAGGAGTDATKVAPPTPGTPEKEKTTIHTVQKGETLSSIAAKYMGNARYATAIAKANPNIHPNRISVGAKLKIPAVQAPTTAPAGTGSTTVVSKATTPKPEVKPLPPVDPSRAYTVKANDGWEALALKFLGRRDLWPVLYEYNKERFPRDSRTLKPGMLLEIPPKDTVAPKAAALTAKDSTAAKSSVVAKSGPAPKK